MSADTRLPPAYAAAIRDASNEVYLSAAAVWEAVIKQGLGKLLLPRPAAEYLPEQRERHGIQALPLDEAALPHLAALPPLHRDPFDRVMIAQALQHGFTLLSVDADVIAYPVPVLPTT